MIIRPNPTIINSLYAALKNQAAKLSKYCIPFFILMFDGILLILFFLGEIVDDFRSIDGDDLLVALPILTIIGAVLGFFAKPFINNLVLKDSASLVTEIKNSGIKIEGDLIMGRMMKTDQNVAATTKPTVQALPRKSYDVAFKISQINNIEISDRPNYSKILTFSVGADKYYLMCLDENDAFQLRDYILYYYN